LSAARALSAVREVVKAFEELVPTTVLKDRALATAIEMRHPAYDCFYLALAELNTSPLLTANDRLIRCCAHMEESAAVLVDEVDAGQLERSSIR
jgi:predicted nucleic acid-binding protein